VLISFVKGIYEKFRRTEKIYIIRIVFKTNHILQSSLTETSPDRDLEGTSFVFTTSLVSVVTSALVEQREIWGASRGSQELMKNQN
jgi:hypothetical protein